MTIKAKSAVVFAYHTVGVKCLQTLIAGGFQIPLVITHADNPNETIWFESVVQLCQEHGIPTLLDPDLRSPVVQAQIAQYQPDYLFSFYFRQMIPVEVLQLASIAPLNMHGSLLPKYRGRVPVNWAVLHGETTTGATLHVMELKPDAGDIVSQEEVAIGPDETAFEVFGAVSEAAQTALKKVLPDLLAGHFPRRKNDLANGSYFGGRKAEDGKIDWQQSTDAVYNLYRAVAPPYPGAFTDVGVVRCVITKARKLPAQSLPPSTPLGLKVTETGIIGCCADFGGLAIDEVQINGVVIPPDELKKLLPGSTNP